MNNPKFPFINNAGVDVAGNILNYLYPDLFPRSLPLTREKLLNDYGELKEFDQKEFIKSDFEKSGLNHKGYIFIPKSVDNKNRKSSKLKQFARKLHVVFHGAG